MGVFAWLGRLLVLALVIRMVMGALMGAGRRAPTAGPRPGPRPGPGPKAQPLERAGGTLVRDPQCGTYLPQARAIRAGAGSDTQYFCSAECRDAYRAAHSSVA